MKSNCAGRLSGFFRQAAEETSQFEVVYDAAGNRAATSADGAVRLWVTDHADPLKRPLVETDAAGVPQRWYVWGGGVLLEVVEADGTVRFAHSDEQGSVVALTDAAGAVTDRWCYGPFGSDWGHSGTNSIPFRWLGSHGVFAAAYLSNSSLLIPHSSLYLTRHRAYDAAMGRFLSADPLGLGGGPNVYAYCLGNPLAYIDPLGLCADPLAGLKEFNRTHPNSPEYGIGDMSFDYISVAVPIDLPIVGKVLGSVMDSAVGFASKYVDDVTRFIGDIPGLHAAKNLPPLRQQYVNEVRALEDIGLSARSAGQTTEDTARMLQQMRRDLGIQYKDMTPSDELSRISARNIKVYNDPLGPTVDWFRARGKTWEEIIESASRPGGKDLGY